MRGWELWDERRMVKLLCPESFCVHWNLCITLLQVPFWQLRRSNRLASKWDGRVQFLLSPNNSSVLSEGTAWALLDQASSMHNSRFKGEYGWDWKPYYYYVYDSITVPSALQAKEGQAPALRGLWSKNREKTYDRERGGQLWPGKWRRMCHFMIWLICSKVGVAYMALICLWCSQFSKVWASLIQFLHIRWPAGSGWSERSMANSFSFHKTLRYFCLHGMKLLHMGVMLPGVE